MPTENFGTLHVSLRNFVGGQIRPPHLPRLITNVSAAETQHYFFRGRCQRRAIRKAIPASGIAKSKNSKLPEPASGEIPKMRSIKSMTSPRVRVTVPI